MKLLIFISQIFRLGGAERLAVELAIELNRRGVHADIVTMYRRDLHDTEVSARAILSAGVSTIHYLNLPVHPPKALLLPAALRLRRIIRTGSYTHLETSAVSPTIIGVLSTLFLRCVHIVGIHHVYRKGREAGLNYWLYRHLVGHKRNERMYAISAYARNAAYEYFDSSHQPAISILYNSIDGRYFSRIDPGARALFMLDYGIPADAHVLLYVGRLARYKGVDKVVYASARFLMERDDVYLLIAGEVDDSVMGSRDMMDEVERFVAEKELSKKVKFTGHIRDTSVAMQAASVLVHPTQLEGFGLALVEALASGLLIITSRAEAIPEVLQGTGASMYEDPSVENLIEGIDRALDMSDDCRQATICRGMARAEEFTVKVRVDRFLQLFRESESLLVD